MRISSSMLYQQAITTIDGNQVTLATLQSQMSSGLRVQTASDDPIAASQVLNSQQTEDNINQWQANSTSLTNRLNLENTALMSVSSSLNSVQQLALQANNSTINDQDRLAIAAQLQQQLQSILAQANTQDGQGRYLFGGTQDASEPFTLTPTGAVYSGNSQMDSLPVAASREIAGTDPGDSTFMDLRAGDGNIAITPGATNSGSAVVTDEHVTDFTQTTGDDYTIGFNGGQYIVTDTTTNMQVATGNYSPDQAIQFDGLSVTFEGAPADGDTFTIAPAGQQDIFTTVQSLINLVSQTSQTPAQRAQIQTSMYGDLQALQGAQAHITDVLGGVGARENALTDANNQLSATSTNLQTTISGLQDLDYAAASTKFAQVQTALQAAEQSYIQIQGLSLFNYIK